jgi:protein-tyrosine phosphatase
MRGYVDIHAHVLPGIDDGPAAMVESLAMARAAAEAGTRTLVATPHLRSDFPGVHADELASRVKRLREAILAEGIELELVSGAEASLVWALEASDDELRLASYAQNGRDLLIETPQTAAGGLAELLYQVRLRGLRITLAHPERNANFQSDPRQLAELVDQGLLLQVNASSLRDGRKGSPIQRLAAHLCREGLAHAIASDGHRAASWRPVTELTAAVQMAATLVGPARAEWLVCSAPGAIVAGEELPEAPTITTRRRSRGPFARR